MAGRRILIADALEDLTPKDLSKFTARLKEPRGDEHKPARFRQGQLNGKDHQGLADLLTDSFSGNAVSITVALLRAIGANRVAEELGECVWSAGSGAGRPPPPLPPWVGRGPTQGQPRRGTSGRESGALAQNTKIYPVTSNSIKNRVALLITNITFAELKNRRGAEKDEENMEELLSTLGYEVVKHTNLTAKKMENALDDFSKHPKLKETDSVFVVISSHGQYGAVHGVNHKPDEPDVLKVDDIYDKLNAKSCPALVDKPKIIIIQACSGKETGSVLVQADEVAVREIEEDVLRFTHKEKDFIALLSSTPRQSIYSRRFQNKLLKDHIEELFRKVMKRFGEGKELPDRRQMPTKDRCTLTRLFFFFLEI
uniref:Caspase-1 n=1 Tax=Neogobius melanostomus TaxID=47308 RepID=A0A8C6SPL7_9GOBI